MDKYYRTMILSRSKNQLWHINLALTGVGKAVDTAIDPEYTSSYRNKNRMSALYRMKHLIGIIDDLTHEQITSLVDMCNEMLGSYKVKTGYYNEWVGIKKQLEDTGAVVLKNCNSIW